MINELTSISLQTYTTMLLVWGAIGIVTAANMYVTKSMPMSSKAADDSKKMLGVIGKRAGWIIMEIPILISVIYFYWVSKTDITASIVFVGFFVFHYIHRALIYPYRIKTDGKTMPVTTVLSSMIFYIINGYLIGYYFGALKSYPWEWLLDPRCIIGAAIFIAGFIINVSSDNTLIALRKPGETGYKIPRGRLYRYVSCPNYFGEILEWLGFAIMSWCLPAMIYFIWVALSLLAQGVQAHHWYRNTFADNYPPTRKAIIPYLL